MLLIKQDWKTFLKKNLPKHSEIKYNSDGSLFQFNWDVKDGFVMGEPSPFPTIMLTKNTYSVYFILWFDINKDRKKILKYIRENS